MTPGSLILGQTLQGRGWAFDRVPGWEESSHSRQRSAGELNRSHSEDLYTLTKTSTLSASYCGIVHAVENDLAAKL